MRTDIDVIEPVAPKGSFVSHSDLIGFHRPQDISGDPVLCLARKRQLLAYWASEIHLVPGAPDLRRYPFGTAVTIEAIEAALNQLDAMVDPVVVESLSRGSAVV